MMAKNVKIYSKGVFFSVGMVAINRNQKEVWNMRTLRKEKACVNKKDRKA